MGALVGQLLQGLGKVLDKYVPGQGSRTVTIAILTVVANVSLFLTGQTTAEAAGNNIILALGLIFAAKHQPPPSAPQL